MIDIDLIVTISLIVIGLGFFFLKYKKLMTLNNLDFELVIAILNVVQNFIAGGKDGKINEIDAIELVRNLQAIIDEKLK